jgi:hypothetical protein
VDRPAVPERAPDFAVELLARDVVALLVGRDREAPPVEGVLAALRLDVLRLDVLRLDVLRDPELDAVVFFLAVPAEGFRCLGNWLPLLRVSSVCRVFGTSRGSPETHGRNCIRYTSCHSSERMSGTALPILSTPSTSTSEPPIMKSVCTAE